MSTTDASNPLFLLKSNNFVVYQIGGGRAVSSTVTSKKASMLMLHRRRSGIRHSGGAGHLDFDGLVKKKIPHDTKSNQSSSVGGKHGGSRRFGSGGGGSSDDGGGVRQVAVGSVDGDANRHAQGIAANGSGISARGKIRSASVGDVAACVSLEGDVPGDKIKPGATLAAVGVRRNTVGGSASAAETGARSSTETFCSETRGCGGKASAYEKVEVDSRDGNDNGTGLYDDVSLSNRSPVWQRAFGSRLEVGRVARGRERNGGGGREKGR